MAFIAALGALRANQNWIDVIGNNLANSATPGFKASRALFADLLSSTQRQATAPSGQIGGTNPLQVGLGVQLSSVDRRMEQGALDITGRPLDLALLGRGFFGVTDGRETLYSRVGTFGLDSSGNMVDLRTGNKVLNKAGATFQIDTSEVLPPSATTKMSFSGNLPAVVTGPLAEELTSSSAYQEGTAATMTGSAGGPFTIPAGETWTMEFVINGGAPQQVSIQGTGVAMTAAEIVNEISNQTEDFTATVGTGETIELTSDRSGEKASIQTIAGTSGKDLKSLLGLSDFAKGTEFIATSGTDLNDLTINIGDYSVGDQVSISGTDVDGSPVVAAFTYGVDGTTLGELTSFLDTAFAQSDVVLDGSTGRISITAQQSGDANLSLAISDGGNQTGKSDWASGFFAVTTNGAGPDKVTTSREIFDTNGSSHVLTFDYERQEDGSWNLDVSIPPTEGSVIQGSIQGITFNEDGSILTPTGGQIEVQFNGLSSQTINLDLGTSGGFDGLTEFGDPASVIVDSQDGFSSGELSSMEVLADGSIQGFYTNGQTKVLGNFGITTFTNEEALESVGGNYFRGTANSGARTLGAGATNTAGEVVGGALETSNVDTAEEFVRLIQAQRGFQANARVVTVQDQLLSDVVNVI
ncbi:MAG TPA: flagellar hook-basal body complex protein [Planctomycetes bacterium]|nr:flagellar hook-basal body complex protein [Planctomycetota bacterium]